MGRSLLVSLPSSLLNMFHCRPPMSSIIIICINFSQDQSSSHSVHSNQINQKKKKEINNEKKQTQQKIKPSQSATTAASSAHASPCHAHTKYKKKKLNQANHPATHTNCKYHQCITITIFLIYNTQCKS